MALHSEVASFVYEGKFDQVREKIQEDRKFLIRRDQSGRTVLHWACSGGHIEIVRFLLEEGACINAYDDDGWTALMIASSIGRADILALLIVKGADVGSVNTTGQVALHYAASKNKLDVARMLLENGAIPDIADNMGNTPLHRAASKGNSNILKLLLDEYRDHLDLNQQNSEGNTALHLACEECQQETAEQLVEAGASVEVVNKYKRTPLDVAPPSIRRHLERITSDEA